VQHGLTAHRYNTPKSGLRWVTRLSERTIGR
jgi:hypothetical protein